MSPWRLRKLKRSGRSTSTWAQAGSWLCVSNLPGSAPDAAAWPFSSFSSGRSAQLPATAAAHWPLRATAAARW